MLGHQAGFFTAWAAEEPEEDAEEAVKSVGITRGCALAGVMEVIQAVDSLGLPLA